MKVFISHAHQDAQDAEQLARRIRDTGVDALTTAAIPAGANWAFALRDQLESADSVVVLWSERAAKSSWVMSELSVAHNRAKPLVFVLRDEARLPHWLWREHRISWDDPHLIDALSDQGIIDPSDDIEPADEVGVPVVPRNKGYAFISRVDEDISEKQLLVGFLAKQGYAYWEYASSKRAYDAHLFLEIEGKIQEAALALIIVSDNWKKSTWALREFYFCEEIKKPFFLLRFSRMQPTLAIAGIPRIDFVRDQEMGFAALENELKEAGL